MAIKKRMPHTITYQQWMGAAKAWNKMYNNGRHIPNAFGTFIGLADFRVGSHSSLRKNEYMHMTDEVYNKIIMLNSPHAYALMKAFIARTGYHKKLPPVEVT